MWVASHGARCRLRHHGLGGGQPGPVPDAPVTCIVSCVQEACDDPYDVNLFRMLVAVTVFIPLSTVVNGVGTMLILTLKIIPATLRAMYHVRCPSPPPSPCRPLPLQV